MKTRECAASRLGPPDLPPLNRSEYNEENLGEMSFGGQGTVHSGSKGQRFESSRARSQFPPIIAVMLELIPPIEKGFNISPLGENKEMS